MLKLWTLIVLVGVANAVSILATRNLQSHFIALQRHQKTGSRCLHKHVRGNGLQLHIQGRKRDL
jgi:hypothetical protein